jgi:carotenoid cleavage dioxygenase-like enzyme
MASRRRRKPSAAISAKNRSLLMNEATPRHTAAPSNLAPIDFEIEVGPLPLHGTLPESLRGTLVRNGPNPRVPDAKAHWFSGDGMLHAFHIADGGYGTPESLSSGMSFGAVSREGRVTRREHFEAPYASMVHDFAVSAEHVMFPVMPLTASRERAQSGRPPFAWEPAHGTRVGMMPRNGSTKDLVWWSGPACYVFHVMNAWEAGNSVFVDVMQFDLPPLFPYPDGSPAGDSRTPSRLTRWTFDLDNPAHEFTQTVLEETRGEFPRMDERFAGFAYRHGWFAGHVALDDGEVRMYASVIHIDHATGARDMFTFDAPDMVSEAIFVPRAADAEEGDGWLLATVWRGRSNTSDLVIFDAQDVAKGPVCTAVLPHRVPVGFHGNWCPEGSTRLTHD